MSRTVIAGGGIIGLCCAYELSRRGEEVVVLDRGEPWTGASSGNAGLLAPSFSGPVPGPGGISTSLRSITRPTGPFYVNPRALPETARWLVRFWRRCNLQDYERGLEAIARLGAQSMFLFDELAADVHFEMHRDGVLFAYLEERHLAHHLADLDRLREYGYARPVVLSGTQLREMEPALSERVRAGFYLSQERHVQPETLIAGLRARLGEMGVEIRPNVVVAGFTAQHRRITGVLTGSESIEAQRVLIAAGAWSGRLARKSGFDVPLTGVKGYSVTAEAPPHRLRRPIFLGESRVIASPFQASTRVAGWLEISGIAPTVDERRIAAMERAATPYLRDWDFTVFGRRRAGLRPLTPDGLPVIGALPGYENLYIASGHGVLGITLAPATAKLLASTIVEGEPHVLLQPFLPQRFA